MSDYMIPYIEKLSTRLLGASKCGLTEEGIMKAAEKALELEAEVERLRGELNVERAVCLCGCQASEHESYGEDGECCGRDDHECLRVAPAVQGYANRIRAEVERLRAGVEKWQGVAVRRTNEAEKAEAEVEQLRDVIFCEVEPEGANHSMDPGMVCVACWNAARAEVEQLRAHVQAHDHECCRQLIRALAQPDTDQKNATEEKEKRHGHCERCHEWRGLNADLWCLPCVLTQDEDPKPATDPEPADAGGEE